MIGPTKRQIKKMGSYEEVGVPIRRACILRESEPQVLGGLKARPAERKKTGWQNLQVQALEARKGGVERVEGALREACIVANYLDTLHLWQTKLATETDELSKRHGQAVQTPKPAAVVHQHERIGAIDGADIPLKHLIQRIDVVSAD